MKSELRMLMGMSAKQREVYSILEPIVEDLLKNLNSQEIGDMLIEYMQGLSKEEWIETKDMIDMSRRLMKEGK